MSKPFIKLLRSPYYFYFFDVNKNQIIRVPESSYKNLQDWISTGKYSGNDKVLNRLIDGGYLSDFHVRKVEDARTGIAGEILESKMKLLVLQVTQSCNLRCSYCIYSNDFNELQRGHSGKKMDMKTAKKAIDFFVEHSTMTENAYISFYGGEPLLEFPMIRSLVEYVKCRYPDKMILFNFTTNATLLKPEIVDYCYNNQIYIMISLDGPEQIHNTHRRFAANGAGSFQKVRKNVKYIKDKYPDYYKTLTVSMVLNEQNDYDEIAAIFQDPVFEGVGSFSVSDIDDKYSVEKTIHPFTFIEKEQYHTFEGLLDFTLHGRYTGKDGIVDASIAQIASMKKELEEKVRLPEQATPSGPCLPGKTRLFVNVEGKFFPCERVSELSDFNCIGNIWEGIDISKVKDLLNLARLSEDCCKNCWAFRHCGLCAVHIDNNGKMSGEVRASFCGDVRFKFEEKLRNYIAVRECKEKWVRG